MSSIAGANAKHRLDEVIFHLAASGALGTVVYSAWSASGSADVAAIGVEIVLLGALVSWWARQKSLAVSVPVCFVLASLATLFWLARSEQGMEIAKQDPGMTLALRMTVLPVAASFFMVRVEAVAFSLVPAVTIFGLSAGAGDESVARSGFVVFLPLALIAVGYAMVASGLALVAPGTPMEQYEMRHRAAPRWRGRHWTALAASIVAVMLVAELLYLPMSRWAETHRWQILMSMATPGTMSTGVMDFQAAPTTYGIGRGPISLSATPVLEIAGGYQPYWRGELFDQYAGTVWSRSGAGDPRVEMGVPPPSAPVQFAGLTPGQDTALVWHRVSARTDLPLIFYAPGEVRELTVDTPLATATTRRLVLDGFGSARVPGGVLPKGATYEVTSMPYEPSKPAAQDRYGGDDARYLRMPPESNRVAELARQIVGSETDPRRQLSLLSDYLNKNCYYSLDAPAVPRGQDAVDYFVFTQKIGYCDLFASSLAIMGRAVGIPTRLVTGYAFPSKEEKAGARGDTFILKEADAHAWVEAFVPTAGGWITEDPTPAEGRTHEASDWMRYHWYRLKVLWRTDPYGAAALTLLTLIVLALVVLVLSGRIIIRTGFHATDGDPQAMVIAAYLRLCRLLRQYGHRRAEAQTPLEYLAVLEESKSRPSSAKATQGKGVEESEAGSGRAGLGAEVLAPVAVLTQTFLDARYGPGPVSEEAAQSARRSFEAARDALRGNGSAKTQRS